MLSETPSVLQVVISSESHRETIGIHLHERPSFTFMSNLHLKSWRSLGKHVGLLLKYNLEVLGFFLLEEKCL